MADAKSQAKVLIALWSEEAVQNNLNILCTIRNKCEIKKAK